MMPEVACWTVGAGAGEPPLLAWARAGEGAMTAAAEARIMVAAHTDSSAPPWEP